MVDDYMLDKVLVKIKEIIDTKEFDNAKILSDKNDKLQDDVTLRNVVMLLTCFIGDDGKFYTQIFF